MENPLGWTGNSTEASVVINATNTMMSSRQLFRSSSVGDDEGKLIKNILSTLQLA